MSHTVFQTAQIMPINTQVSSKNTILPKPFLPAVNYHVGNLRKREIKIAKKLFIKGFLSSPDVVDGGESVGHLERCFTGSPSDSLPSSSYTSMVAPTMKGQYGSLGSVTLEKSKLDLTQKQTRSSPELATGGGGGDIGKRINNGGGDGGDDGGDDDDYFDDFDEGDDGDDGGLFRRRSLFKELFDRKFVDAVLNEWQKTVMDLPAGFRQAYEMGLVSSAQMVRFLAIHARPTTVRAISRALPQGISRAFVGRMIADPAFLYKLLLEQVTTIGCSTWWELNNRKDRIKQEWDLALINVVTAAACNAAVVWSLAPCRSYGNTFRYDLQNTLQKLPNNVFEKSYPVREFDMQKRIHSFFYKAAELCLAGLTVGAVQGGLTNLCSKKKNKRLSVTVPSVKTNALGTGAFLGLYANLRYQLLCGLDRGLTNHFDVIGVALFLSTAFRVLNVQIGETSRLAWLGIEGDPLVQSNNLMKAYNRPAETNVSKKHDSNWFISRNTIISGLGLLGFQQGGTVNANANANANADSSSSSSSTQPDVPKPRRKRVVRKKVSTSSA